MASRPRSCLYTNDLSLGQNPSRSRERHSAHYGADRINKLSEMTMSGYVASQAKLKKRSKVKGQLTNANALTFIPAEGQSQLVVADNKTGSIGLFTDDVKTRVELTRVVHPHGVASLDDHTIVVVDEDQNGVGSVKVISFAGDGSTSSTVVRQWGSQSDAWKPRGVAVTRTGQIVVTNVHPDAIERFWLYSGDGSEAMSFGRAQGPADLVLRSPSYVTVDSLDRILTTDTDGNCVKIYDQRGRYLTEFGSVSRDPRERGSTLSRPRGIACDNRNNIIVCDSGNRRLAMFSHDGRFIHNLREAQKPGLSPVDLALNSSSDRLALSVHNKTETFKKLVLYDYIGT